MKRILKLGILPSMEKYQTKRSHTTSIFPMSPTPDICTADAQSPRATYHPVSAGLYQGYSCLTDRVYASLYVVFAPDTVDSMFASAAPVGGAICF